MDQPTTTAHSPNGWLRDLIDQIIEGQKMTILKQDQTHEKLDHLMAVMVYKADCDKCRDEQQSNYVDKRLFTAGIAILGGLMAVLIGITAVLTLFLKGAEFAKFIGLMAMERGVF